MTNEFQRALRARYEDNIVQELEKEAIYTLSTQGLNEETQGAYFKDLVNGLDRIQTLKDHNKRYERIEEMRSSIRSHRQEKLIKLQKVHGIEPTEESKEI